MQRFAYWLTPIIAIGVILFIVLLLYRVNQIDDLSVKAEKEASERVKNIISKDDNGWLERLSESERLGYFFPVNEIYIDVDLNQKIVQNTIYRLKAAIKDPYQLFCLKEELRSYQLNYFLQKDQGGTKLLINSKDQNKLHHLVETLKSYQIMATVVPFKKEEEWKNIK